MKLYHGSILKVDSPKIVKTLVGRDFGCAFYTTDILRFESAYEVKS